AGIFHADPHPGNTIVMYDGRVGLVDFGIMGYLDEETMQQIAHVFLGFAEHDYDLVMEAFETAGLINADRMDLARFRQELKEVSEPFYGRSLKTIAAKDVYDQTMRLVYKYHITLPRNLLLLLKTFIQTEALGKILDSDASLLEVTRPYARRLLERGYDAQKIFKNLGREAKIMSGYLRWMPKLAHDILRRLALGEHRLDLRHSGLDKASAKFETGLNRLTIGLVVAASIIAASLILNSSQQVMVVTLNRLGIESVPITQLLGLVGYVIATVLGLWLIFSIIRSGKL
ncbi:MAG: AarF/ABC1/UbiB kinase family protein, partial [Desulfatitalea sp.]|nr:AarF/ABC1/UbiB kinase family protein [Desulfatitalea sp.]NNJ99339.1 AarF/ABC1/UbiB kinase family protein [Desulfatitalea sp.]